MKIDLRSAALGAILVLLIGGVWYDGSVRPVIQNLTMEKAQAVGRANELESESAKYKAAAEHWAAIANSQQQAAPTNSTVAVLNAVRPGLGTVLNQIGKTIQQQQAASRIGTLTCPPEYPVLAQNEEGQWKCYQQTTSQ